MPGFFNQSAQFGGDLLGQRSAEQVPGRAPAAGVPGSFINPTATMAAIARSPFGPAPVAPLPPVGAPPPNRDAALAAAISGSGQTQFGQNQTPIPPTLPLNLMGRTGDNKMFERFLDQRGQRPDGRTPQPGSQLAGNDPTLSAIAQMADPAAGSQLASNTGVGGLLDEAQIEAVLTAYPWLSRDVLNQVLADNTAAGQQFVQDLLEGRGASAGAGGFTDPTGGFNFDGSGVLNLGGSGSGIDPLSPAGGNALLDVFRAGSPGLPGSPHADAGGLLVTAGPFATESGKDPLFGSLEGGHHVDRTLGTALNLATNEAALQQGRTNEATDIIRNLAARLGVSPAQTTADRAATAAGLRTLPGSLDELRGALQGDLDTSLAAEDNAALNRMRDLGLLGQGAASTAALGGHTNRLGRLRQQGQFDITKAMEALTRDRIGQASQVAPRSAQVTQALTQRPLLDLAQTLLGPRNPAQLDVINFLKNIANLQSGTAMANQGPSGFELLGELGGDLISSVGDIISAKI